MYNGYVTTIKEIHKHSNADRLQCVTVFGNNAIVDMSYKMGQKVVFFPVDGQLSEEFATKCNLIKKYVPVSELTEEEIGNKPIVQKDGIDVVNVGGYMDAEKRNITALKLRGEKSEGLILPIETLSDYTDINKLKDGDTISTLNGHEICKKYIPIRKKRGSQNNNIKINKKELKEVVAYPFFCEHIDTQQLAYNQNAFKEGDICYITLKMHGCFKYDTRVRLANGKQKRIHEIKVGDDVLCYDFNNKIFKPTKVINTFKNAPSFKWRKIKFSRTGLKGDKRGYITCTPNHQFWHEETKSWIYAENLEKGMEISMLFPSYILSKQQREILVGNFLGDGSLRTYNDKVADIETSCKNNAIEYMDYLIKISGDLYHKNNTTYISGYGTKMIRSKTMRCADIYKLFNKISTLKNSGDDKLKDEIIDEFSPLSMAILYMDDGSLSHSEFQNDRANFALCDYSEKDINIIQKCFKKFGIDSVYYKDPNGYGRLRLNHDDAYKMFDLIHQYIPEIMRYKLPESYRNFEYKEPQPITGKYSYLFSKQIVLDNYEVNKKYTEYDLETEEHNYIVGNAIVHNTSQRTANTVQVTTIKKNPILKKLFHLKDKVVKEYKYISGTRRTTLREYDGGYYGDNKFRQKYHDFLKDKLPKGVEIFYEVVGYANGEQTIMGKCSNKLIRDKKFQKQYGDETVFSYGCGVGENDAYVYRMTMTNEDGYAVEIPWEQVQIEAEKMGMKCVPTFEKFIFTTWEDLMERVEKYYDGVDPIGKTHVREGVVVRIDNRPTFTAYKHKNFSFKCLEGIIKDNADAPDMEEAEEIINNE